MKKGLQLYILAFLCAIASCCYAQNNNSPTLNIGDTAPALRVREWLKGTPQNHFEKGKIYLVEFWATWCGPCIAEMPHLSALASKYTNKLTVIGVDIYERKTMTIEKLRSFVDSLGYRIDYNVAAEDSNQMATTWVDATADPTIPKSFVINAEGKVAWIGHPKMLDEVLPTILNNTWDVDEALARRNLNLHLEVLDRELTYDVITFINNDLIPNHPLKPDSVLFVINNLIAKEPKLKYAPFVAYYTFSTLLHTDPQKAYAYGKVAIETPTYDEPAWYSIVNAIELYGDKLNLPPNLFLLGAEAEQARIDHVTYPALVNLPRMYALLADFYLCANETDKAVSALEKAISIMKNRHDFSAKELTKLESRLELYATKKKAF